MGPWGPSAKRLFGSIGFKLRTAAGGARSFEYLKQRISLEIQHVNAVSILSTFTSQRGFNELFFINARDQSSLVSFF